MNELRELRRAAGLGQREFAALLAVPLETFRTWDSGRRSVPVPILQRAAAAVAPHLRQSELVPLDELARELHVHMRTLQAAARTGRLHAHFSVRSVFGRPIRFATRAAGEQFVARPSPVVWQRVLELEHGRARAAVKRGSDPILP
jgi:transcriptional regulator with XRE-family HTH domain